MVSPSSEGCRHSDKPFRLPRSRLQSKSRPSDVYRIALLTLGLFVEAQQTFTQRFEAYAQKSTGNNKIEGRILGLMATT